MTLHFYVDLFDIYDVSSAVDIAKKSYGCVCWMQTYVSGRNWLYCVVTYYKTQIQTFHWRELELIKWRDESSVRVKTVWKSEALSLSWLSCRGDISGMWTWSCSTRLLHAPSLYPCIYNTGNWGFQTDSAHSSSSRDWNRGSPHRNQWSYWPPYTSWTFKK
jgi:hypothetical protein